MSVSSYRRVLGVRDFRLLASAFLIDQIGSWAYSVILALVVYERTGSTFWLAAQFASRWVPQLVLSGYAGVIADRYDRVLVMRWSARAAGAVMVVLTVAVALKAPVWTYLVLAAMTATVNAPYAPSAGALTPNVVDETQLGTANALFAVLENLVIVIGPAIGALIVLVGQPSIGLALNAASFFAVSLLITRLAVRSRGGAHADGRVIQQWWEGLRAIASEPRIVVLVGYAAFAETVYGASTVVFAPLAHRVGLGSSGYGYLLASGAAGSVLAAGLADRVSSSRRLMPLLVGSALTSCLPFLLTAYTLQIAPAIVWQVVGGAGYIVLTVMASTALQRTLPADVLGRVLGVYLAIAVLATLAGSFIFTPVLEAFGVVRTIEVIGIAFGVLAVVGAPLAARLDRSAAAALDAIAGTVHLLGGLDLFADLPRSALEQLAATAVEVDVPARSVVLAEGDEATDLFVLVSGSLTVRARGNATVGRQLPRVEAPGYVGELGLIHRKPRSATVRAAVPSRLLRISGSAFLAAMESGAPSASFTEITGARLARTSRASAKVSGAPVT